MLTKTEATYIEFMYNACHPQQFCPSPPYQYFIESTNICNLKCKFCIQHTMKRSKSHMSMEIFRRIIDSIYSSYGFVSLIDLSGQGEPLMVPHIYDMIKYAKDKGCESLRIQTNATLLSEDVSRKLIASGMDKINFSFGSHKKDIYEKTQINGDFEKTLRGIVRFLEIKKEQERWDLDVTISTVQYKDYACNVDEYLEVFSKLPFNRVKINKFHPWLWTYDSPYYEKMKNVPHEKWCVCKAPWRIFSFKRDGMAMACNDDWEDHYTVGNINDSSVEELWNGDRMQAFRRAHVEKEYQLIGPIDQNMCLSCGEMWMDPKENGATYPQDFQTGLREMMAYSGMGGRSKKEVFAEKDEMLKKYDYLEGNKEKWFSTVLRGECL